MELNYKPLGAYREVYSDSNTTKGTEVAESKSQRMHKEQRV